MFALGLVTYINYLVIIHNVYTVHRSVDILDTVTGNYPRYQNSQFTLPRRESLGYKIHLIPILFRNDILISLYSLFR